MFLLIEYGIKDEEKVN